MYIAPSVVAVEYTDCFSAKGLDSLNECWPSRLGQSNTLTASLQKGETPPRSALKMTLNNLIVRFQ